MNALEETQQNLQDKKKKEITALLFYLPLMLYITNHFVITDLEKLLYKKET